MRHNDHRCVIVRKSADNLQHLSRKLRIQRRGRFIKAENIRPECKSPCDRNALLLASGELVRIVVRPVGKPHLIKKLHGVLTDLLLLLLFVLPLVFQQKLRSQHHILQCRILRKQVERLKHHAEVEPLLPDFLVTCLFMASRIKKSFPSHLNGSAIRRLQEVQAAKKGCFAGA